MAVVCAPATASHWNVYAPVPPLPAAVAWPFVPPLQLTLMLELMLAVTAVGSVRITEAVSQQLLSSQIVTI